MINNSIRGGRRRSGDSLPTHPDGESQAVSDYSDGLTGSSDAGNRAGPHRADADAGLHRTLAKLDRRTAAIEQLLVELNARLDGRRTFKSWYNTTELADLLGKSDFTVREKWCNQGRVACEKDP